MASTENNGMCEDFFELEDLEESFHELVISGESYFNLNFEFCYVDKQSLTWRTVMLSLAFLLRQIH